MQRSLGLGASTTWLDVNNELLNKVKSQYPAVNVAESSETVIKNLLPMIDIVVGDGSLNRFKPQKKDNDTENEDGEN